MAGRPGPDPNSQQGRNLKREVETWATPRVHEAGAYQVDQKTGQKIPTLDGQSRSFRPDQARGIDGLPSSLTTRTLSPLFVEWLMGWPPGWTLLAIMPPLPDGSTGFACSATAFCLWKRRMRSALSLLPIALPEPTKQTSLFG